MPWHRYAGIPYSRFQNQFILFLQAASQHTPTSWQQSVAPHASQAQQPAQSMYVYAQPHPVQQQTYPQTTAVMPQNLLQYQSAVSSDDTETLRVLIWSIIANPVLAQAICIAEKMRKCIRWRHVVSDSSWPLRVASASASKSHQSVLRAGGAATTACHDVTTAAQSVHRSQPKC